MNPEYKLKVISVSFDSVIFNKPFELLLGIFTDEPVVFLKIKYKMKISLINVGDRDFPGGKLILKGKEMVDYIERDGEETKVPPIKIKEKVSVTSSFPILDFITKIRISIDNNGKVRLYGMNGKTRDPYEIPIYVASLIDAIAMITSTIALIFSIVALFFSLYKSIF